MTGPKAVLQASQNDESFTDSIEDLIDEYLELIFPSEDTSETMQMIELMTSRDPDSKIRAIVATEGAQIREQMSGLHVFTLKFLALKKLVFPL